MPVGGGVQAGTVVAAVQPLIQAWYSHAKHFSYGGTVNRKKLLRAVESTAETAAEKGQAYLDEAVQRITPYVEQASDYVGPLARDASRRGAELASDAYDRVQPALAEASRRGVEIATDTYDRLQPHLKDAKRRGARLAADALDRVHPILDEALDRVTPAVEGAVSRVQPLVDDAMRRVTPAVDVARDRVQHDLLPRFSAALHEAAEHPLAKETSKRLTAATAALMGEIELPTKPKRRFGRTLAQVAVAGAVLAGVVIAVRKLLGTEETGWEAHEPNRAYVADPVADVVDDLGDKAAAAAEEVSETADHAADAVADVSDQVADSVSEAADQADETVADLADDAQGDEQSEGDASPLADSPYGEGSYVGQNPPEGFDIKGNERSRKYHLQGTGGYERTITDVWFNSAEAAEHAGFVRAQR